MTSRRSSGSMRAERSLISFEAKAPQPTSEVHNGAPRLGYVLEPLQKGSLSKGKSYYHSRGSIGILRGGPPSRLPCARTTKGIRRAKCERANEANSPRR